MNFNYTAVEFECSGQVDICGPKGVPGIRPYFEAVDLTIVLYTDETTERVNKLIKNVEHRCAVMNLLRGARVDLNANWSTKPVQEKPS